MRKFASLLFLLEKKDFARLLATRFAFIVASTFMVCYSARAQTTSTEVLGTVTDSTDALVPGAKVTLRRVATGERREMLTTSTGDYSFPLIEVGQYVVTVSKEGFRTQERIGIVVELQQKARVNFELTVGEGSQTVAVVATGVELKTDDVAVGQVIENKRVVELPLNGRNLGSLAVLTAGVQYGARYGVTDTGNAAGGQPIPGRIVSVSANGQRDTNQRITLDGVKATDPVDNAMNFSPSIDAIEEFKVQTSSYSAEYGMNNGAVVQVAFKSGTNKFHGTFYEFLRNDSMDAKDYFLNFQTPAGTPLTPKNRLRRNQFGVFLSGPVRLPKYDGKNRTFWSFSYEGLRETNETVQYGFFYPQAFRNGDFSSLIAPSIVNGKPIRAPIIIYDPSTGQPFTNSAGQITNIIPASLINKNAQNFINKFQPYPMFQPSDPLANNAQAPVPNIISGNQYLFRVDHEFRSQDKVFAHYITDRPDYTNGNLNPNFDVFVVAPATNVAFQYIHLFSPQTLNEFRYGLNKNASVATNPRSNTSFDLNALGIGNFLVGGTRPLSSFAEGIPATLIGGDRDSGWGIKYGTQHEFSENLSVIRGSHALKAGFAYMRLLTEDFASNNPRGILGSSANEGGYALVGFLMGYLDNSTAPEGLVQGLVNQNRWAAYILDDWKVSRKLTVNLGLRWDFFQVPLDASGNLRNFRFDILSQASNGQMLPTLYPAPDTKNFGVVNGDNRYFMPRVGLAYRLTDKWVIRAGSGWFVNAQQTNNYFVLDRNPPAAGAPNFNSATQVAQTFNYAYGGQSYSETTRNFAAGSPILTLDNAFPGQGAVSPRTNLYAMTPNNRYANDVQWSFDIQRALPWNTFMTVGYVGSKTSHLDNTITDNSPPPNPNTNINAMRPIQAFVSQGEGNIGRGLGSVRILDSAANGSYEGLQTSVEKRYQHGLLLNFNYVFSKALGQGYERNGVPVAYTGGYQNPLDRKSEKARYPFDVTHLATISFVYEMPFLNRFKGAAGAVLAGWQVNGIISLHTGYPFGVSGGNLNTGSGTRPDRIGNPRLGSKATRQQWFDPTAFQRTDCNIPSRPDLCHFGNSPNDALVSPGMRNMDLSVYKNWRIPPLGEAARVQFRVEAFNSTNSPHFGMPVGIGFVSPNAVVPDAAQQGQILSLLSPMRILQLGLKVYF
jgi:hypothetical protein